MSGQVNHTHVISLISPGLNLANEKETMFVREATTWQGELLSGQIAAVDEHEFPGVKADCPAPSGSDELLLPNPNGMTADVTEIIDDDSAHFRVRSGVHPHPSTDSNGICGTVVVAWALGHTSRLQGSHVRVTRICFQNSGIL